MRNVLVEDADRYGFLGIPVFIEPIRDIVDHGTDRGDILVEKLARYAGLVILIREISPADDGHLVVDGKRLVVHAPVQDIEVRDKADQPGAAPRKGIEYANLDVDVVVQAQEARIDGLGQGVVHEQSHPDTAICSLDQLERDEIATQVIADQVTLDIDAPLGFF